MKQYFIKNNHGISLVEMMVSITLIGILSSIVVLNFNSIGKKNRVNMAAQQLASDIRKMQSNALNAKSRNNVSAGWGVYLSEGAELYKTFFDHDKGNDYDDNANENVNTISLPKGVKIKTLLEKSGSNSFVLFNPPDPETKFITSTSSLIIILSDSNDADEKRIRVNTLGLVDVEN